MNSQPFGFETHDVFAIVGRGLVCRGRGLSGQAVEGDKLIIAGQHGRISGFVNAIEKDRKLMETTVPNVEIGSCSTI